jgi:hypothetical protein
MGSGDVGLIGGRPSIIIALDEGFVRSVLRASARRARLRSLSTSEVQATTRSMCVSPRATDAHNLLEPAGPVTCPRRRHVCPSVVTPPSG